MIQRTEWRKCICNVCGREWIPRTPGIPKLCPNPQCKSSEWNEPIAEPIVKKAEQPFPKYLDRIHFPIKRIGK